MSDTFDHASDAYESCYNEDFEDYGYDGPDSYNGFDYDELYYHNYYIGIKLVSETDKAYLIKFDCEKDSYESWVPKKLCKQLKSNSIYIWEKFKPKPVCDTKVEPI